MAKYYHPSLNRWGPNLSLVFSGDKDLATLEYEEFAAIIKAVKNCKKGKGGMIDTSEWGTVSFVSSLDRVIEFLANCVDSEGKCVFSDFKLPEYDSSKGIKGFGEDGLSEWANLFINYKAQRTINVINLVTHLCNFKSSLVFGATGRRSLSTNSTYINDGQHHYIAVNKDEEKTFFFAGISKKDVKKKLINWITENKISIPMWKIKF